MQPLIDRITRLYREEARGTRPATSRHDIPATYGRITTAWLTDVLCHGTEARVEAFRLGEDDDGTSNRRRIHLTYNAAGQKAGLPASVFCKASFSLASRLTLGTLGCTHSEYTFYSRVRDQLDMEAPVALWTTYNPDSFASILVLRDLGEDVEFCDERTQVGWERARGMVLLLADLHGRFHQHPELGKAALPFTLWTDWFGRLQAIGMEEYTSKGFRAAEAVIPPRLFRRAGEIWQATLRSVASHRDLPHTLLHSDTHLRNWYLAGESGMGLADWQAVCVGNWARDYAYATACALSVENRRAWERELLAIYLDRMRAHGAPAIGFDDAWRLYRQQLFAALAFWTVTLTPPPVMPDMQPVPTTLAFIERFAAAIDDLDALDSF